jgi:membrane-associated phospholipid phosphatase
MSVRAEKALISFVLAAVLAAAFFCISARTAARAMAPPSWLLTPLDTRMRVVPAAVWIYLTWYPAAFAVLLGERDTFRCAVRAYLLAFVMCVIGYLALPVVIDRPIGSCGATVSGAVLERLYRFDPPVNVFPSFHAAIAAVLWRLRPRSGAVSAAVSAWTVALCLACVVTRQHYILDVVAGLVVGGIAIGAADAVGSRAGRRAAPSPRARLARSG